MHDACTYTNMATYPVKSVASGGTAHGVTHLVDVALPRASVISHSTQLCVIQLLRACAISELATWAIRSRWPCSATFRYACEMQASETLRMCGVIHLHQRNDDRVGSDIQGARYAARCAHPKRVPRLSALLFVSMSVRICMCESKHTFFARSLNECLCECMLHSPSTCFGL